MDGDDKPHVEHIELAGGIWCSLPQDAAHTRIKKKPRSRSRSMWLCLPIGGRADSDSDTLVAREEDAKPGKEKTGFWQRLRMKKFGFGKKSSDGDDDSVRSGMFGRKKESPKLDNPYAQSQLAEDPYARMTPYQQAKAGLSSGPRPGGAGLPGGPAPPNAPGGPPPPYSSQSGPTGGYGADRYGSQNGYGSNRYETNADAYAANSRHTVSTSRPGGYGGLGSDDTSRDALFGGAKNRYDPEKSDGRAAAPAAPASYGGAPDNDGNRDALFGASKDRYPTQQAGGSGASGAEADSYGGYGQPRPLTTEELDRQEYKNTIGQISEIKKEDVQITDRINATALQTYEVAMGTLARLGAQGERLHNVEKNLDLAANHNRVAEDRTKELTKVTGSMFAVHVNNPFTKKTRKEQLDAAVLERHQMERSVREATRRDEYAHRQVLERDFKQAVTGQQRHRPSQTPLADRLKFEMQDDEDDDDEDRELKLGDKSNEDRIDENMKATLPLVMGLKSAALAMSEELDRQNDKIDNIAIKSDNVDDGVRMNRAKLSRIR